MEVHRNFVEGLKTPGLRGAFKHRLPFVIVCKVSGLSARGVAEVGALRLIGANAEVGLCGRNLEACGLRWLRIDLRSRLREQVH
eukprot:5986553-Pyramimonas_sp.AAC.1